MNIYDVFTYECLFHVLFMFKCCTLHKPVLGGVNCCLHLPPPYHEKVLPNRACNNFNLGFWTFFRGSIFLPLVFLLCFHFFCYLTEVQKVIMLIIIIFFFFGGGRGVGERKDVYHTF